MFGRLGVDVRRVTLPRHIAGIDGLVIPGGESTTIGKLLVEWKLLDPLREYAAGGGAMYGSCAGMIVMARDIGREQPKLGIMDIVVERNAFGRQLESFETSLHVPVLGDEPFPGVFIRAPRILRVGPGVETIATLDDGTVVGAREGKLLAVSFHAELTPDTRLHQYFLRVAQGLP